jgi:hypothetical protein
MLVVTVCSAGFGVISAERSQPVIPIANTSTKHDPTIRVISFHFRFALNTYTSISRVTSWHCYFTRIGELSIGELTPLDRLYPIEGRSRSCGANSRSIYDKSGYMAKTNKSVEIGSKPLLEKLLSLFKKNLLGLTSSAIASI